MTGEQCKIARKLLGWSLDGLANRFRINEMDVARGNAHSGFGRVSQSIISNLAAIRLSERNLCARG
jgi:hypothetical protein